MPKMKSHRGAKKRFKVTKKGKVKYRKGYRNHMLTKKKTKRKRQLRKDGYLSKQDAEKMKKLMPYD